MSAVALYAFGLSLDTVTTWLSRERLQDRLSQAERDFLSGAQEHLMAMQMQVHSVYALAWCTSVVSDFAPNDEMPDDLARRVPNVRELESSEAFRGRVVLRSDVEVLTKLDATYCFHWAIRDAHLTLKKHPLVKNLFAVTARRKALEWAFAGGAWDDVPLDT